MSGYRLPTGGRFINREHVLRFAFDGRAMTGFAGDTLASALIASGRQVVARSFKYHRPRGVYSAGHEEPTALVTIGTGGRREPNAKSTVVELGEGLEAFGQNAWPSVDFDLMAVNQLAGPVLGAGFYYKTFIGTGQRFWHFCEHFIRRAAGMGKAGLEPDPDRYEQANAFADVLVVGAGPAGIMAALSAVAAGQRVILADENPELGGSLWEEAVASIDGVSAADWTVARLAELDANPRVTVFRRTSVFGYFDDNVLGALERVAEHEPAPHQPRHRLLRIHAAKVVIATGAIERPLVFAGNDRPGVMLASAVHRFANRHGVAVGRRVVAFVNNDAGIDSALGAARCGVSVTDLVDPRNTIDPERVAALTALGIRLHAGHVVTAAQGTKGLRAVRVAPFDAHSGETAARGWKLRCDALMVSGGYTPQLSLCSQAGTPPRFDPLLDSFVPGEPLQSWRVAGAAGGGLALADALREGANDGGAPVVNNAAGPMRPLPLPRVPGAGKSFVDLQHDVTAGDIGIAHAEGFRSVEHMKRYTTLGMAADQGKTSNVNAIALMGQLRGLSPGEVGTTRFRPPYVPISLGALGGTAVGDHLQPVRRTPMHEWHLAHDAEMIAAGAWVRPRVYRLDPNESLFDAYVREARAVRESVGIVDVTSLGKIEVQGPDAAEFLNRIYSNPFLKVPVGKARYGAMLREDGILADDGTSWRLSETRFLTTTTTAGAATVLREMERLLAVDWPDLKVHVASVSDQWAGMAVAGPRSRATLQPVLSGLDIGHDAFGSMAVGDGVLAGCPVKVARLSFSGELAFEVYCGWRDGPAVWQAIIDAGAPFGITPYGTEALGTLRIEKGHISGPELDGRTTLDDLGLGKMASTTKSYVGGVLRLREGLTTPGRPQLVGLVSSENRALRGGMHLVAPDGSGPSQGHVTSTTFSPERGEHISLALVERGRARHGEALLAVNPLHGEQNSVRVVDPCFIDPEGCRTDG